MADLSSAVYPFDPTGKLASNLITGEQQILTASNTRNYKFIVPKLAPFFEDGLVVSFTPTSGSPRTLVKGIDYLLAHEFISASRACAAPIWGSISFLDMTLAGVISLDYQTLGGVWTQDDAKIAQILADSLHNPRVTAWEQVVDMVISFPVIDHQWDLVDLAGASELIAELTNIEDALRQSGNAGLTAHINDSDNPHHVTAAQVNLGNVRNLLTADAAAAALGTSDDFYMTPHSTSQAIAAQVGNAFNTHVTSYSNPHNTTAAQVGAYTKAQTDILLGNKLDATGTAFDTANFDGRDAIDFKDWVNSGTSANTLKFNGLTADDYRSYVLTSFSPAALNLYTISDVNTLLGNKLDVNGVAYDTARVGGLTVADFTAQVLSGQAADAAKLAGLTVADLTTQILSGQAADSMRLEGMTKDDLINSISTHASGQSATQVVFSTFSATPPADNLWTLLGSRTVPDANALFNSGNVDMEWLVAGTELASQSDSGMYFIRTSVRQSTPDNVGLYVLSLNGIDTGAQFGYVVRIDGTNTRYVDVYVKTADIRNRITVTELNGSVGIFADYTAPALTAEPAGIVYATFDSLAKTSEVNAAFDSLNTAFQSLQTSISS